MYEVKHNTITGCEKIGNVPQDFKMFHFLSAYFFETLLADNAPNRKILTVTVCVDNINNA
jgi:hypothetical protein